jgi:hypothetical protein
MENPIILKKLSMLANINDHVTWLKPGDDFTSSTGYKTMKKKITYQRNRSDGTYNVTMEESYAKEVGLIK